MIYFDVGRKKPKIVIDDYHYLLRRKDVNCTLWICAEYYHPQGERCKVSVISGKGVAYIHGQHNHKPRHGCGNYSNMKSRKITLIYQ